MPFYIYYNPETEEEKEVFHGIHEEPEVIDSRGNLMKRKIVQIGNFFMGKDNKNTTRRTSVQQKQGHKKTFSSRTPYESSRLKMEEQIKTREQREAEKADPYYHFRD